MKTFLYGTPLRRILMRFLEIAIITGVIAVLQSPEFQSLLPAVYVGIVASLVKALREFQSK